MSASSKKSGSTRRESAVGWTPRAEGHHVFWSRDCGGGVGAWLVRPDACLFHGGSPLADGSDSRPGRVGEAVVVPCVGRSADGCRGDGFGNASGRRLDASRHGCWVLRDGGLC